LQTDLVFVLHSNSEEVIMRELTGSEVDQVSGGNGEVAMALAGSWAGTVTSAAIGFTVGGPVGGLIGGFAGFFLGGIITVGYQLSQPESNTGGGGATSGSSSSGSSQGSINRTGGSRIAESS
jgi:hypothetical protein